MPATPPFDVLPALLRGAVVTLELALAAAVIALLASVVAGLARLSKNSSVRLVTGLYVEVFRGTSLLVQLFWVYYVFPFVGISLSPFVAGALALGLNAGAYGSEIVRGAVLAVPQGQTEAAIAINMTARQTMRRIILPQAMIRMLPPFGNLLIETLKGTALASLITLSDLTFQGFSMRQTLGRTNEIFSLVLVLYFVMAYPLTLGVRWLERRTRYAT